MSRCKEQLDFDGTDQALGKLITAQITLGKEVLKLLGAGLSNAKDSLGNIKIPKSSSCCDIPEPCWMPVNLGDICCQLKPGDTGEICFMICNEDFHPHDYTVTAAGTHSSLVQIHEKQFTLSPKACHLVSTRFIMPVANERSDRNSCCEHNDYDLVIWVQGCRNHYLKWHINANAKSKACCHEINVSDIPDYELHWYDHFHVIRPCLGTINTDVKL